MARFPGAIWSPITAGKGRKPLALFNRVNLHVAVSEATSLHDFFNRTGQPDSHFYVRRDGTVEQYVDTGMRAFADLEGNDATISIETQGGLYDPQGEPWTDAQVESLAQLYAWAVREHGIERKVATSSKLGAESRGLSWHRLGIDGNFPALPDARAGRTQRGGGMRYSSSRGKACPGDAKIGQVPAIFARASAILDGAQPVTHPVSPAPVPAPTYRDITGVQRAVRAVVDNVWGPDTERRVAAVRAASRYGGRRFPDGVAFTQRVVGTPDDNVWGKNSNAAHDRTVRDLQAAVGAATDCIWGPETDRKVDAARAAARRP